MSFGIPQCALCAHYDRKNDEGNTCKAFPDGIPSEILLNEADHTEPFPGDHGVRFEPVEGE